MLLSYFLPFAGLVTCPSPSPAAFAAAFASIFAFRACASLHGRSFLPSQQLVIVLPDARHAQCKLSSPEGCKQGAIPIRM